MKLNDVNEEITLVGSTINSGTMGVKITSKLFSLMVDGLYQDKYGAVIRELSANALDAHDKLGKSDIPFILNIPNGISNTFFIRDFGSGLSKENMVKFFCTLLESDKDGGNEARGAYGIGCKSPFSVVDEFTVTSWYNGIKTIMLIARENKGTPTYYILSEEKSDEENGVKIEFESDKEDVWLKSTRDQLAAFKVKPLCNVDIEWYDIEYLLDDKIYLINNNKNQQYIEMGEILYPINFSYPNKGLFYSRDIKKSFVLKVCIGDVMVPPDRERIEINDASIALIDSLIGKYYDQLNSRYLEEFSQKEINTKVLLEKFLKQPYIKNDSYIQKYSFNIDFKKYMRDSTIFTCREEPKYDLELCDRRLEFIVKSCKIEKDKKLSYLSACSIRMKISDILNKNIPIIFSNNARMMDIETYMIENKLSNSIFIKLNLKRGEHFKSLLLHFIEFYEYDVDNFKFLSIGSKKSVRQKSEYTATALRGLFKKSTYGYRRITKDEFKIMTEGSSKSLLLKDYKKIDDSKLNLLHNHCEKNDVQLILCDEKRYNANMNSQNATNIESYFQSVLNDKPFMFDSILTQDNFFAFFRNRSEYYDSIEPYIRKNKQEFIKFLITKFEKYDKIYLSDIIKTANIKQLSSYVNTFDNIEVTNLEQTLTKLVNHY